MIGTEIKPSQKPNACRRIWSCNGVALTPLNPADVSPVDIAFGGETLLRNGRIDAGGIAAAAKHRGNE